MNTLKHTRSLLFFGVLLMILPGFRRRSNRQPIPSLPAIESADYAETKEGITLQAKQLNKPEAEQILGKQAGKLWQQSRLRKKNRRKNQRTRRRPKTDQIIPIQLSIKNETNQTATINSQDIDLHLIKGNEIAKRLRKRSLFAAVCTTLIYSASIVILLALRDAFGLVAFVGSGPIAAIALYGEIFLAGAAGGASLASPIASTRTMIKSSSENRRVRKIINKNSFANVIDVAPGQQAETLIFVAKCDYQATFDINVQIDGSDIPFTVTLQELA